MSSIESRDARRTSRHARRPLASPHGVERLARCAVVLAVLAATLLVVGYYADDHAAAAMLTHFAGLLDGSAETITASGLPDLLSTVATFAR